MRITDFTKIMLPYEGYFVLVDFSEDTVNSRYIERIPLSFRIDYADKSIENPSPLVLLINPATMSFSLSKKVNANFARGGYVVEEWGESQDTISCEGKIGGYFIKQKQTYDTTGLSRYGRDKSESFKNLMHLVMFYRSNGAVFQPIKTVQGTSKKLIDQYVKQSEIIPDISFTRDRIKKLGNVYLEYDDMIYQGAFNDFSITENSENPYFLEYSFTFIIQYRFLRRASSRNLNYYKKVLIDTGDIAKYNETKIETAIQNSIKSKQLEIKEKNEFENISVISPLNTASLLSDTNRKQKALDESQTFIEKKGISVTTEDRNNLKNEYEKQNPNYEDKLNNENSINNQIKNMAKSQGKNDEDSAKLANEITPTLMTYKDSYNKR